MTVEHYKPKDRDRLFAGHSAGGAWATRTATDEQIRRLEDARDLVHDWRVGEGLSEYREGERVFAIIEPEADPRDQNLFAEDEVDDPDFVHGFAEAAVDIRMMPRVGRERI